MRIRPVAWTRDGVHILDQTRLPDRETYLHCTRVAHVVRAIRKLQVRGAPLIGITAAYAMALARPTPTALRKAAEQLMKSRPTAVNLSWAVERVLEKALNGGSALQEAKAIHKEDAAMCEAIGKTGARLKPKRILTICNTGALATGGIGTAFGVALRSKAELFACETRPLSQGARLTMWEAKKWKLKAQLIVDGAAATTMQNKGIDLVVTGADRIARNGDTANKVGTLGLALAAREFKIPFYIAAPSTTFDPSCRTGKEIPIEERDSTEISPHFPAFNPAFDVTPAKLITGFITEKGIFPAGKVPLDAQRVRK